MFQNFQSLDIVSDADCKGIVDNPNQSAGDEWITNSPNPFTESTTIQFKTRGGHTLIQVIDMLGRVIQTPAEGDYNPGTYTTSFDAGGLPNGPTQQVRPMLKVR